MASIIRIKRSSGTNKPSSLNWGELAYVTGIGSYGGVNQYKDRIFIGDDGTNANPVGGYYYTSMMEHQPGSINGVQNTRNTDGGIVAILDSNRKVDEWNVDNLTIDSNSISSTNTDGDIILDPNGVGEVNIPDDTYLSFGTDKDARIRYDEAADNRLEIEGAQVFFANTTDSESKDTGSVVFDGGVGIERSLHVGANLNVTSGSDIANIRIRDNIISTKEGSGNVLYLDPYPDALDNAGKVVVKGDLQVDGTTTTVNSTSVTVNEPILRVGDVTSVRTVTEATLSGVSTIRLDSVVGINTGDQISGSASLPNSGITTIISYDVSTKIVTIVEPTSSGISTSAQLSILHQYDTNTDRGMSFDYYSSGTPYVGFFGYIDGSNPNSYAPASSWTYIPDANVTNNVASGVRGFLDVKGIYYQTSDYNTSGVVYFNSEGLQTSTNNPANAEIASKQILTALTEVILVFSTPKTVVAGDIILQETNGAYGIVKTSVTGTNVVVTGVEGTFNTANNILVNSVSLGATPTTVTPIHTNKPHWTSTLDGGTF